MTLEPLLLVSELMHLQGLMLEIGFTAPDEAQTFYKHAYQEIRHPNFKGISGGSVCVCEFKKRSFSKAPMN